jgi:hypothetical protein
MRPSLFGERWRRVNYLIKKVEMKIAAYIQLHTAYEYINPRDGYFFSIDKQHGNNMNHKRTASKS